MRVFLIAAVLLLGACKSWSELETPKEKFQGASLALLLRCKEVSGDEAQAAWDKYMPGKTGYTFLSSDKGKELMAIMKRWEDEDCNFDESKLSEAEKARVRELIN